MRTMLIKVFYFTPIIVFMLLLRVKHTLCQLTRSSQDVVKYNIRPIKQNNIGVLSIIISDKMKNKMYHTSGTSYRKITKGVQIDTTCTTAHFPSLVHTLQ